MLRRIDVGGEGVENREVEVLEIAVAILKLNFGQRRILVVDQARCVTKAERIAELEKQVAELTKAAQAVVDCHRPVGELNKLTVSIDALAEALK